MVSLEPHASSAVHGGVWLDSLEGSCSVYPSPKQAMVGKVAVPTAQTAVCGSVEYNIADLTRETISITFILMRPFLPQLLLPGSQPFILLEKQILQLVRCPLPCFWDWNVLPASLVNRPVQLLVVGAVMANVSNTSLAYGGKQTCGGGGSLP